MHYRIGHASKAAVRAAQPPDVRLALHRRTDRIRADLKLRTILHRESDQSANGCPRQRGCELGDDVNLAGRPCMQQAFNYLLDVASEGLDAPKTQRVRGERAQPGVFGGV